MTILIDTREKENARLQQRCESFARYERKKLNYGDYSIQTIVRGKVVSLAPFVVIERKMGLDELCACFCKERKRFTAEFERAREHGCKVYLLLEDTDFNRMYGGKYRSQYAPKALTSSFWTFIARYNVTPVFCKKEQSGQIINDILCRELKEFLKRC